MSDVEYLSLEDALQLVRDLGAGPVRDVGLLDSAIGRPSSSALGRDACPTLALKAAALMLSLARNHVLVDGDKRLAWLAAVVFLDLNGCAPTSPTRQPSSLSWRCRPGVLDVDQIEQRLNVVR